MKIEDAVRKVFERCDIIFEDSIISKESLLRTYAAFISDTMGKKEHNVGLILHPGSICFDVISLTVAMVANMVSNETSSEDVVSSLLEDDIVLYGSKKKERYKFSRIIDGGIISYDYKGKRFAVLKQDNQKTYVSEGSWRLIVPYNGDSKSLDGKGIRKKSTVRDTFFENVLEYNPADIPGLIDTSSVLVMPRSRAEQLIKGISYRFGNKTANVLDLVTASYFTEEDEYSYGGNTGKNEAVIKICGKVSAARSLILSKKGNRHMGLIVNGQEVINRGQSELPELLNRKSLQYVYISTTMDSDFGLSVLEENEESALFACTKDFLCEHGGGKIQEENYYTRELSNQINNVIHKELIPVELDDFPADPDKYIEFKKSMLKIKRLDYESDVKDEFIVQAHSLMNLFLTAVFSMSQVNRLKEQELIPIDTPSEKIKALRENAQLMPSSILECANQIVDLLDNISADIESETAKEKWLKEYLYNNKDKKIAVVVPKAYYITILREGDMFSRECIKNVSFVTAGRFDNSQTYDVIIVVGNIEGKRFDAFRSTAATKIISLLYEVELKQYKTRKRNAENGQKQLSKRSSIKIRYIEPEEELEGVEESDEITGMDSEIDDYISNMDSAFSIGSVSGYSSPGKSNISTEIIAVATFEDDRKAFFSRHYKAYVFDSDTGITKEVETEDLCDGDSIVFTKNNDETKDIVDSVMQQLISDNKLTAEQIGLYRKSKEWQKSLWNYMEENNLSMIGVAEQLISTGVPVQTAAVLRWLDEDAHTVGPRKVESLKAIGKLTGNEELENHPDSYFQACREIRALRRKILGQIGDAIIDKLSGKRPASGTIFAEIYDRIDDLSEILQIERIVRTERTMPLGIANRPINLRG